MSPSGLREQQALTARIASCGNMFFTMKTYLEGIACLSKKNLTREVLHKLAREVNCIVECPKIDRLASRKKDGMICWFAENCTFLLGISPPSRQSTRESLPVPVLSLPEAAPFHWDDGDIPEGFRDWMI
jgi:hypothetical protein